MEQVSPDEGGRRNVLIIDDEPLFLRFAAQALTSTGCSVETATDAREGLQRFEKSRFDAVVIDLLLRETTGWEVVAAVRGRDPAVGTILISALAEELDEALARARGFDLVLSKPVEADALREAVAEVSRLRLARLATTAGEG